MFARDLESHEAIWNHFDASGARDNRVFIVFGDQKFYDHANLLDLFRCLLEDLACLLGLAQNVGGGRVLSGVVLLRGSVQDLIYYLIVLNAGVPRDRPRFGSWDYQRWLFFCSCSGG